MRSARYALCIAATVSACTSAPKAFTAPVPSPTADAFSCANTQANQLGYTLTSANADAGFLKAERRMGGKGETAKKAGATATTVATLGVIRPKVSDKLDELTVSVFADGGGNRQMRVTAATIEESGGNRKSKAPSGQTEADARALLAACGAKP